MPIFVPVILGGAAVVMSIVGLAMGAEGVSNLNQARKQATKASMRHAKAVRLMEQRRREVNGNAEAYAKLKLEVIRTTMKRALDFLEQTRRRLKKQSEFSTLSEVDVVLEQIGAFERDLEDAKGILGGSIKAAATGSAAGGAAWGLVGTLGTASTGAAISGLSGAAATNATLAWLGGGSLAVGGGGMALGTVILGGVVVGPILAIGGFSLATQGEKALSEAKEYEAKANKAVAELEALRAFLDQVSTRLDELSTLVSRLDCRARANLDGLDAASFDPQVPGHVRAFQQAFALVKALAEVLRAPVLDDKGNLNSETAKLHARYITLAGVN